MWNRDYKCLDSRISDIFKDLNNSVFPRLVKLENAAEKETPKVSFPYMTFDNWFQHISPKPLTLEQVAERVNALAEAMGLTFVPATISAAPAKYVKVKKEKK